MVEEVTCKLKRSLAQKKNDDAYFDRRFVAEPKVNTGTDVPWVQMLFHFLKSQELRHRLASNEVAKSNRPNHHQLSCDLNTVC